MPWLTVHLALPLILLAGRVVGDVFEAVDWRPVWHQGGGILAFLLVPTAIVLFVWIGVRPFQGLSMKDLAATTQWLASLVILFILLWAVAGYIRKMGARWAGFVAVGTLFVVLALLTIRFSLMANYINDELAKEYIVYAHATPDDKLVVNEIQTLADRLNQTETIKIAYDAEVVWPFEWYVRDYDNRQYFGEVPGSQLDAPIVMVGTRRENEIKPYLGDRYVRREYKMRWWPDEGYKGLTWQRIRDILRDPERRRRVWNVIWRRKYDKPLNQWPHVDRFALYIRKDIVPTIWQYGAAAPEWGDIKDEYSELKISLTSNLTIGSQGAAAGQFDRPKDVAPDANGNIYVCDIGNNDMGIPPRIQVFSPEGVFLRGWGSLGSGPGQFNEPWGLAVDAGRGFVYVADTWNHRVQKFDLEGKFITQWGTFVDTGGQATGAEAQFWGPRDVAVDAAGNVYVTDTGNKRIQKFDGDGKFLAQWGGAGANPGQFSEPVGIAISPTTGDIFITDTWNRRVQRFDQNFNPLRQWFVQGWDSESVVNKPYIALDDQDNVFITDPENYRVIEFDAEGKLLAVWGDFGSGDNQLNLPTGIAIDPSGQVYIGDSDNHRVLRFPAP
jgi:DNA-binding beta-propeller fold protein YncE